MDERGTADRQGRRDAVFFDLDDTLYDQSEPFANAVRSVLGPLDGVTGAQLFETSRTHSGEIFAALRRGERPTKEMYVRRMQRTMADYGIHVDEATALCLQYRYARGSMSLSDAMASCLDWCASRTRAGVGIVTNGRLPAQAAKVHGLGIDRWVADDHLFVSDDLGVAKPDPRIFLVACERMGVAPERSLYVGDAFDIDVVGARAARMPVVWFNRRQNPRPQGDVRPTYTVGSDVELAELLRRIV